MKKFIYIWILSSAAMTVSLTYFTGCMDEESPPDPPIENTIRSYFVGGSYGDIIDYKIDREHKTYTFTNTTTGQSDQGSFVYSTNPNLEDVYEFNAGSNFFYGLELPGELFATSLPSGNQDNRLCFGLSNESNLSTEYTTAEIAGKYIFAIYNDLSEFEWGGYEIHANGTFTYKAGPEGESDFNEATAFAGEGMGTWKIDASSPNTILFKENGEIRKGTVSPGKYMIIDMGPGEGFIAGIKYPEAPITQASIAGKYTGLDVTPEGYLGVHAFTISPSSETVSVYYNYYNNPYMGEGTISGTNFRKSNYIKNVFVLESTLDNDLFYTAFIVMPGEALLYYTWGDDGMVSYGIAGKLN
jgi:hypothetical protein